MSNETFYLISIAMDLNRSYPVQEFIKVKIKTYEMCYSNIEKIHENVATKLLYEKELILDTITRDSIIEELLLIDDLKHIKKERYVWILDRRWDEKSISQRQHINIIGTI